MSNPWDNPASPADSDLASTLGSVIRGLKPDISMVELGIIPHYFGGDAGQPITQVAYPSGATYDKLAPNTDVVMFDFVSLPGGSYKLQAMLAEDAGTMTIGIFNLTDAPDAALAEISSTGTAAGELVQTAAITFAAAGATKTYGVKVKVSAGNGWAWGVRLVRVP